MALSIVISHRSADFALLQRCLDSFTAELSDKVEVIVVDSSDHFEVDELKKYPIQAVHSDRPLTCGMARNIGAAKAAGKYVWCVDADDTLRPGALQKVLDALESGKDMYYMPWVTYSRRDLEAFWPTSFQQLCKTNIAAWNKVYKRELYVPFPDYHPEDVVAHFKLLDKVQTFGALKEAVYEYDDINPQAYTRTFDWLKAHPCNLIALAHDDTLTKSGMRDEAVPGCLRTVADLYQFVHEAKNPEVKAVAMRRLQSTWMRISAGYYIH